jgi:hypothetical protein
LVWELRDSNLDVNVKNGVPYKNCLIHTESFQREKNGAWIPQYTLVRPKTESTGKGSDFPSHQYQFNEAFPSETEADAYAFGKAMEWVDAN